MEMLDLSWPNVSILGNIRVNFADNMHEVPSWNLNCISDKPTLTQPE